MSSKKKLLLILFVLCVAGMGIGYYFYNKGPRNVRSVNALRVDAPELYKAFVSNSGEAQKKYSGKILLVSGVVGKIDANQQKETILFLNTNEPGAYINCGMEESNPVLQLNERVSVKGFCSGMGQGDADLGIKADVYLTRCWVAK
jgi:hypothetical protein